MRAGRSYLRRIAQPLASGETVLSPLRMPLAKETRPPAILSDQANVVRRRSSSLPASAMVGNAVGEATAAASRTAPAIEAAALPPSDTATLVPPSATVESADISAPPKRETLGF